MIEILPFDDPRVLAVKSSERVGDDDFQRTMPLAETMLREGAVTRLLLDWQELEGWDEQGAADAFWVRMMHRGDFERVAIVAGDRLHAEVQELQTLLRNAEVRCFSPAEESQALTWLREG